MSTKPILYCDDRSAPVRSVFMLIKKLNIDVEQRFVDLFSGNQYEPDFSKINLAHTVPVLMHDDLVLTDSHAILIHLCEKFEQPAGGNELWPKDYVLRMKVLNRMLFHCFYLFSREFELMSGIVRKGAANIDMDYHENRILQAYDVLESMLQEHTYMASDNITLADFSIINTLCTMDIMFPIATKDNKWQKLLKWLETMKKLPEYSAIHGGLKKFCAKVEEISKSKFPNPPI